MNEELTQSETYLPKNNYFASVRPYKKTIVIIVFIFLIGVGVLFLNRYYLATKGNVLAISVPAIISVIPNQGSLPPDIPVNIAVDVKTNKLAFTRTVILFDQTKVNMTTDASVNPAFGTVISKSTPEEANTSGKIIVVAAVSPNTIVPDGIINNFVTFTLSPISVIANDTVQVTFDINDMQFIESEGVSEIPITSTGASYTINPVTPVPSPTPSPSPSPSPSPIPTPTPSPTLPPTPTPTSFVDTTPPSVNVTDPTNGAIVPKGSSYLFKSDASDNVGVTKVEFYISGKRRCTDLSVPYECQALTPTGANVTFPIQAKAFDAQNNSAIDQITVTTGN